MNRRKPPKQLRLFADPEQPGGWARKPEFVATYRAVLVLRMSGRRCFRLGHGHHLVDGKSITTAELIRRSLRADAASSRVLYALGVSL